jgi:hypothetical protein
MIKAKMLFLLLQVFLCASEVPIIYIPSTKTPPSKRIFPVVSFSKPENTLIVFSGYSGNSEENELWKFNFSSNSWKSFSPLESQYPSNN